MNKRKDLFYGHSLKGKSRAIAQLVSKLYETTGKKSRLYIGDGGVGTYENTGLVKDGILEVCDFSWMSYPSTVLLAMSRFWWPDKTGKWFKPTPEFLSGESHAMVIFEGATVIKQWLMGNNEGAIADKIGKGEKFGGVKDDAGDLITVDGKVEGIPDNWRKHGQITGLHYMKAYREIESAIQRTSAFNGWVVWTAHPTEAPDLTEGGRSGQHGQIQGKRIIGPDVCGKSKAATISSLFGNTLHFDTAMKTRRLPDVLTGQSVGMLEPEYRIYTRDHFDPDGREIIEFRAGNRNDPKKVELYYTSEEPGLAVLDVYKALGVGVGLDDPNEHPQAALIQTMKERGLLDHTVDTPR